MHLIIQEKSPQSLDVLMMDPVIKEQVCCEFSIFGIKKYEQVEERISLSRLSLNISRIVIQFLSPAFKQGKQTSQLMIHISFTELITLQLEK